MEHKNYLKIESKLKYFFFLILYFALYIPSFILYHKKNLWILCERGIDAQDNGYIFYKYLKNNQQQIKLHFLIAKTSKDREKIYKKDLVNFGSLKHFMLVIGAKVQISSHLFGYCPWTTFMLYLRRHKTRNIHVFLQHGITYNNQVGYYKNVCKALSLYFCGSKIEQKYICNTFGYSLEETPLTGFARFDNLHDGLEKKCVLVMPTWRRYLKDVSINDFKDSLYYKNWYSLLTNKTIHELCSILQIDLVFYLHLSLQPYTDLFVNINNVKVIKYGEKTVQEMLKKCSILITDYSSVMFDCLYMEKNIVLYQFDKEMFIEKHYSEGFFDTLDKNVFPSISNEENVILTLRSILLSNNELHQGEIKNYSNNFFEFKDKNNCNRIFEIINSKL